MNETQQPIPERVYRIIGESLNRTVENGNTPAEAEQAAQTVQELLLKYNLSLSDIHGRTKTGKQREFTKSFFDLIGKQKRNDSDWVCSLVHIIATHNMSRAIHLPPIHKMVVLGEVHNIEVVLYLVDYLIPRIETACKNAWTMYWGDEKKNTFRRGFLSGCVAGINEKLKAQAAQMAAANNSMLGMIKVNGTELQKYVESVFGENTLKPPNRNQGKLRSSAESKVLGYIAGKNMQINKGLKDKDTPTSGYLD